MNTEYLVVPLVEADLTDPIALRKHLDELGRDEWEFVQIVDAVGISYSPFAVFVRELVSDDPPVDLDVWMREE